MNRTSSAQKALIKPLFWIASKLPTREMKRNNNWQARFCRFDFIECRDAVTKRRLGRRCGERGFAEGEKYATWNLGSPKVVCQTRTNRKALNEYLEFYIDHESKLGWHPESDVDAESLSQAFMKNRNRNRIIENRILE